MKKSDLIKGLEICSADIDDVDMDCDNCPYKKYGYGESEYIGTNCDIEIMRDALKYLGSTTTNPVNEIKDFTTEGMSLEERYDILNKVDLIPIGTVCYKAGDFTENTEEIVVEETNQKVVTMFWNNLYFLDKEKADEATFKAHAEYANWLFK